MNRTTTMRAIGVIAALGLGLTTAACSSDSKSAGGGASSSSTGGSSANSTALVVESNPVASFTEDYNPLSPNSIGKLENTSSLIYEPLFQINSLDSSQAPIPWLADKAEWSNGNKTVTITLHSGVKWSDGQDFTADDVKFTFDLIKSDAAANAFGAPTVSSTSVTNPTTVVLNFDSPQKANFVAIAQQLILPQHIWKSITKPETAVIKADQAIGTGPYLVDKFSSQLVTYKANPTYWQGEPKVKAINLPAYADNNAASAALAKGDIDLTGNNIANVQTVFVGKDPQNNHLWTDKAPYYPQVNTVSLLLNNKSKNAPQLADAAVRKAISAALNRQSYASQCETDYELPATSSGGLTAPVDGKVMNSALNNDLKPTADQAAVDSLMKGAGYTKVSGKWSKNGKTVKFKVTDPQPYTDYACGATAIAKDLTTAGFDVTADLAADPNAWSTALANGNYDASIHWGQGATPFQKLQFTADPRLTAPIGQTAANNLNRYDSTKATALFKAYEASTDDASAQAALNKIQQLLSDDMPSVPLLYGAAWYQYTDANFTGFPNESNPYMNPSPNAQAWEYIILKLSPKS